MLMSTFKQCMRGVRRGIAPVAGVVAFAALLTLRAPAQTGNVVPSQYIAKVYTEAFGRAPDQIAWANNVSDFLANGCTLSLLQATTQAAYTNSEFNSDYATSDYQARLIALYRGALNRDPDQQGFDSWMSQLNGGTSWSTVVSGFVTSPEFQGEVATICSASNPDYGVSVPPNGAAPAVPAPIINDGGFDGTGGETALQSLLHTTYDHGGGTVCMDEEQVIVLSTTLDIPAGVTLTTCNSPAPSSYARMARLERGPNFTADCSETYIPTVQVEAAAALKYVWVDGQRNYLGYNYTDCAGTNSSGSHNDFNLFTMGGPGTVVNYNRISEARGGAQVVALGSLFANGGISGASSCPASGSTPGLDMESNLITEYTSIWNDAQSSDGIDSYCEDSIIKNNIVIDSTDVPIIIFGEGSSGPAQQSQIISNTVVQAGNNSNSPLCLDQNTSQQSGANSSFAGMLMEDNLFWTGAQTYFAFGICAGTGPWFPSSDSSTGGTFTNNYTGSLIANVRDGIEVGSNTTNVTITNDASHPFNVNVINFPNNDLAAGCPGGTVIADPSATGTFPTPVFTGSFDSCQWAGSPATNYSLANSSWATGDLNGWPNVTSTSDVYVEDAPASGYNGDTYDLIITNPFSSYNDFAYQYITLPNGSSFTASVYAKGSSTLTGPGGYLMVTDSNNKGICSIAVPPDTTNWTQVSCTGSVPSNRIVGFQVGSNPQKNAGSWVRFDSASLTTN